MEVADWELRPSDDNIEYLPNILIYEILSLFQKTTYFFQYL